MNSENYRKAMEDGQKELEHWLRVRIEIDQRIAQLKSTVALLGGLIGDAPRITAAESTEELVDMGISDAIRQVLREHMQSLTPGEIKVLLAQAQFDLDKYVNASAVIHNTLKRLESQGEIASITSDPPGVTTYFLKPRFIGLTGNPDVPYLNLADSYAAALQGLGVTGAVPSNTPVSERMETASDLVARLAGKEGSK
jgi:hypothetical protein